MKVTSGILATVALLFLVGCANDSGKDKTVEDDVVSENKEVSNPKESRPLSEIAEESELEEQDCEDKFKNEHGICEVPNPEYPKELIDKKYNKEDKEADTDSDQ